MKADFEIGIIGAGFSGIIAALRLQQSRRHSFVILERAAQIGGTWRDNTYPGCACDVPSNLYSITQAPNPNWSRQNASQAEILEYLKWVITEHKLESRIQFQTDVCHYEFLETHGLWCLTDRTGRTLHVRSIILSTGPFSHPKLPEIPGIESFAGDTLHSARWKAQDLTGKRVAVIGTGASAVQIVPSLAATTAQLTVFQRSAAWIGDRMDHVVPESRQKRYRQHPWIQAFERGILYWTLELRGQMMLGNKWVHKYFHNQSLKKLEREVLNPELRAKLTPTYTFGCKRILSSDDYLPCFNRENVTLETEAILEITPTGIRTNSTHHKFDVIIFATGFDVADVTKNHDVKIIGRNKRELFKQWSVNGAEAYKGSSVSGYPNLNFMLGPNTGLGHSSMIAMMEAQMNYIIEYTVLLERHNGFLDLKPDVQRQYNTQLQKQFTGTVWASGCKSWYLNSSGKNTTLFPRLVETFRRTTLHIDPSEYESIPTR
jgi:cation diffusion facilitator CzcD-associated flavoprotein CzcO